MLFIIFICLLDFKVTALLIGFVRHKTSLNCTSLIVYITQRYSFQDYQTPARLYGPDFICRSTSAVGFSNGQNKGEVVGEPYRSDGYVPTSSQYASQSDIARLLKLTIEKFGSDFKFGCYATDGSHLIMTSLVLTFTAGFLKFLF